MKKFLLYIIGLSIGLQACKKENPAQQEERKPEIIINSIVAKLAGADSISNFTNSFKNLNLSESETKDGLTIFAPLNEIQNNGLTFYKIQKLSLSGDNERSKVLALTDSVLKNHIVKGVYKLADLTNGKILTSLSGKQLNIYKSADTLWINGVIINKKEVLANNNEVVFVIKQNLSPIQVIDTISVELLTEETFSLALQSAQNDINLFHKNLVLLDGILSHDAEIDSLPPFFKNSFAYRQISNFSFDAANNTTLLPWKNAYSVINKLNYLEVNAPADLTNKADKIATIKVLRAYAYMQLLAYYGNIVLLPKIYNINNKYNNTDKEAVIDFINTEYNAAALVFTNLQQHSNLLNKYVVKALQAKMYLLQKDYQKVIEFTEPIINSSIYQLEPQLNVFSNSSKEIIWNNSADLNVNIQAYFYNRTNLPYLRFTEILLMNAEANLLLGNSQKAQSASNQVMQRSGKSGNVNINSLQQTWLAEMRREGNSFINLIRWDKASSILSPKGFLSPKNNLLPIPQSELHLSPEIRQNPGY